MKTFLDKLLEQHSLITEKCNYYLSVYCPVNPTNRNSIDTHIKSLVLKALRRHKDLAKKTRLHNNILNKIQASFSSISNLNRGIGIFIKFNLNKQQKGRHKNILDSNFNIVSFSRSPKKEIFIGNLYSLDQLIWMDNVYSEALVLNIDIDKCEIFEIEGRQINLLHVLENSLYSSGSNSLEPNQEETIKHFINEIIKYVSSSDSLQFKFEFLIIFYSQPYNYLIHKNLNINSDLNKGSIPILISKNVDNPNDIRQIAVERIREFRKIRKNNRIEVARENYSHYCEGWKEVSKALNRHQVSTLFIKPTIKKAGYINIQTMQISTYPKNRTIQVKNIAPWAVISVTKNGGEVVTLREDSYKDSPEIAAQLRYAKKRQKRNNKRLIKQWVDKRNGVPAIVRGTDDLLRIKFADSGDLEEISWERFYDLLDKNDLLFIYDNEEDSRFCTFVNK